MPLIHSSLKGKQLTLVCLVYTHNNVASVVFLTFVTPCFNYLHVRNYKNLGVLAMVLEITCGDHIWESLGLKVLG